MVSVTTVAHVDDIDGAPASETVLFALDGASYEIDLTEGNADALRQAMTPFVVHARRLRPPAGSGTGKGRGRAVPTSAEHSSRAELSAIRTWAADNGIALAARGRVPQDIRARYEQAHS